jgi:hypothetical protein
MRLQLLYCLIGTFVVVECEQHSSFLLVLMKKCFGGTHASSLGDGRVIVVIVAAKQ